MNKFYNNVLGDKSIVISLFLTCFCKIAYLLKCRSFCNSIFILIFSNRTQNDYLGEKILKKDFFFYMSKILDFENIILKLKNRVKDIMAKKIEGVTA